MLPFDPFRFIQDLQYTSEVATLVRRYRLVQETGNRLGSLTDLTGHKSNSGCLTVRQIIRLKQLGNDFFVCSIKPLILHSIKVHIALLLCGNMPAIAVIPILGALMGQVSIVFESHDCFSGELSAFYLVCKFFQM